MGAPPPLVDKNQRGREKVRERGGDGRDLGSRVTKCGREEGADAKCRCEEGVDSAELNDFFGSVTPARFSHTRVECRRL